MRTARASKDFIQAVYSDIGAMVVGRFVFDQTNGWGGQAVAGDHVFVVTHEVPKSWEFADTAPFTFVTDGVESAVAQAREVAGDRIVDVAAGDVGGQALRLGLVDQVVMNVVPVVFGEGRPFFGSAAGEVTLANPSLVAQGDRVTHPLVRRAAVRRGGVMEYAAYARKLDVPAGSVPERLVFKNVEARAVVPLVAV